MKHNCVTLYGIVTEKPIVFTENETEKVICKIQTVKGLRYFGNDLLKRKKDTITIISCLNEIIDEMKNWNTNDIVEIKGALVSLPIDVKSKCSHCDEYNEQKVPFIFVNPLYAEIRHCSLTKEQAEKCLYEHREISNQITIGGTLTTPPQHFISKDNVETTSFNIETERRHKFNNTTEKSDNFSIKTFGFNARSSFENLEKGSISFIDGFLSNRKSNHSCKCKNCGKAYSWSNSSLEIIANSVEFF